MKPTLESQANSPLIALLACLVILWLSSPAQAASSGWDAAAAQLASQIAAILGPGQAQIQLTNRSAIPASELPSIRQSIEEALRSRGVKPGSTESANGIRITLSENKTERLWIAEVLEGSQIQIVMVRIDKPAGEPPITGTTSSIRLERRLLWSSQHSASALPPDASPILAALEANGSLLLLMEERLTLLTQKADDWIATGSEPIIRPAGARPMPREPRGALLLNPASSTVTAYLPGLRCTSKIFAPAEVGTSAGAGGSAVCETSDDPWPLNSDPALPQRAFYNAARNYFTGVLSPGLSATASSIELPPFYAAQPVTASGAKALLVAGVDGKARLATAGGSQILAGAHDWGSDFVTLTTSCGTAILLASSSGEAREDSLRAYDLRGAEALAVSEPLALKGSIIALGQSSTPGAILAILRTSQQQYEPKYEVDRVSALCQ